MKRLEKLEPLAQASQLSAINEKEAKKRANKMQAGGKAPKVHKKKTKDQLKKEEEELKRQQAEDEERARREEEERLKKEEEDRLKKEEEDKKTAKGGKGAKGKKAAEEEKKDEPVVETEEQKLER